MADLGWHCRDLVWANRPHLLAAPLTTCPRPHLVPEVPCAGKNHRDVAFIRGGNHFGTAPCAPGLNRRSSARFPRRNQTIRKREKCVTANDTALERKTRLARFPGRD